MKRSILFAGVVGAVVTGTFVACAPTNRKVCDGDTFANEAELCIDRAALGFSAEYGSGVFVGTRPVETVSIVNRGLKPLLINKVTYEGEPEFKATSSWGAEKVGSEIPPTSIEGGKSAFLQVEFAPRQSRGYSGSITIESNASNLPRLAVQLSGCGVPPIQPDGGGGTSNCYSCDVLTQGCTAAVDGGPRTCYQSSSGATFCSFETGTKMAGETCDDPWACVKGSVCLSVCERQLDGGSCATTAVSRCYQACSRDGGASGCAAGKACLDLSAQNIRAYGACTQQ
jgi:hypothetical protein